MATLREIKEALRERKHVPVPEVGKWLAQVVAGYFAYHAVPTNSRRYRVSLSRGCLMADSFAGAARGHAWPGKTG